VTKLALGINDTSLAMVKTFRQTDQQTVVLMGYTSPIEQYDQRHELEAG
jgi:tryptophan synthase alpha subunit